MKFYSACKDNFLNSNVPSNNRIAQEASSLFIKPIKSFWTVKVNLMNFTNMIIIKW